MKILFTGKSNFQYNRVKVLVEGLKKLKGVELVFYPITTRSQFDAAAFSELEKDVDFIFIPPFRHRDVKFIKKYSTKPIVFDPLVSQYLTKEDFGHFWKKPFKYFFDKIPFQKCDILLSDTENHRKYYSQQFNIPIEKIFTLYIGVDTSLFYQTEQQVNKDGKFRVGFYGSFVPLQGTDKIMKTAKLLEDHHDISFEIIGGGYRFQQALDLHKKWKLKNVNFLGVMKYEELNAKINEFDICLGVFGDSKKASFVVPNKAFHYASTGKCFINRATEGIQEVFTDGKDIVLCGNEPEDMAEKILMLKNNPGLIKEIGQNAFKLITEEYNEVKIATHFVDILNTYQKANS